MAMSLPTDSPHLPVDGEAPQQPDRVQLSLTVSQAEGDWADGDALVVAICRVAAALKWPSGRRWHARPGRQPLCWAAISCCVA